MKLSPINIVETDKLIDLLHDSMSKEKSFHEKLVTYTDIGMVILDRCSGQFVFANPSAQKIYNRDLKTLQSLTLNHVTDIDFMKEAQYGIDQLEESLVKSYKMAKVYIIPPDNIKKVAFMELVEIATEIKFPYILGIIIEHTQLKDWYEMSSKVSL